MISKELLSEVLGCDSSECYFEDTYNLINYKYQYDVTWSEEIQYDNSSINIHELTHKCKEWAWNSGYLLILKIRNTITIEIYSNRENQFMLKMINADTEPEAIFKACQWILENKEMK